MGSTVTNDAFLSETTKTFCQHIHTCGTQEEQDCDPINPEEHESKKGPKWLEDEQWQVNEDLSSHMEQGNGESYSFAHN